MDWSRGHTIGHGASAAAVYTATLRSSGEILAVKSIELSQSTPLQREQKILSTLNHPNIIGYRGCDITLENSKTMFNLLMEYAPDGPLSDRSGARLDESTISRYTYGIVKGLEYLHSRGIVHCDIKLSNILLSQGEAKIADFGCAKAADEAAVIGGTPMYMSPEVARGEKQGFSADIWAVGCTIIEMATGNSPWPNSPIISTLGRIAFSGETPEIPGFLSDLGKDFLSKCLVVDPNERWTAERLFRHPFIDESRFGVVKQMSNDETCSPTCVLDHGIWSSIEEDCVDLLDGMKELCVNSGRDNWEWGERWITVRDSKNVNVSINCGSKSREQKLVLGRNCSLQRDEDELVLLDQFLFL